LSLGVKLSKTDRPFDLAQDSYGRRPWLIPKLRASNEHIVYHQRKYNYQMCALREHWGSARPPNTPWARNLRDLRKTQGDRLAHSAPAKALDLTNGGRGLHRRSGPLQEQHLKVPEAKPGGIADVVVVMTDESWSHLAKRALEF
jgi:hypothetical protein